MDVIDMEDRTRHALQTALGILAKAGENDDFSDGKNDPHVAGESYTEAKHRFESVLMDDGGPPKPNA